MMESQDNVTYIPSEMASDWVKSHGEINVFMYKWRWLWQLSFEAVAKHTGIVNKCHKVYLHSFSAGQAEFQLWHRCFPELLVGCSWLTTRELNRKTLLITMPATVMALETDSPHLASRVGIINSSFPIYKQAVTIGEIRNLPPQLWLSVQTMHCVGFMPCRCTMIDSNCVQKYKRECGKSGISPVSRPLLILCSQAVGLSEWCSEIIDYM